MSVFTSQTVDLTLKDAYRSFTAAKELMNPSHSGAFLALVNTMSVNHRVI